MPNKLTLKAARVNAGFNQTELGKILGVAKTTVGNWEAGTSDIPSRQLAKFCEVCGVSMDAIFLPCNMTKNDKKEADK